MAAARNIPWRLLPGQWPGPVGKERRPAGGRRGWCRHRPQKRGSCLCGHWGAAPRRAKGSAGQTPACKRHPPSSAGAGPGGGQCGTGHNRKAPGPAGYGSSPRSLHRQSQMAPLPPAAGTGPAQRQIRHGPVLSQAHLQRGLFAIRHGAHSLKGAFHHAGHVHIGIKRGVRGKDHIREAAQHGKFAVL